MDRTGIWYLLLVSILYIWTGQKVSGKCTGPWAIHACGGGNGKRSDVEAGGLGDREKESRISLQRILRGFGEYSNEDEDSTHFGDPDLSNYVEDVLSQQPDLAYIQKENRKQQSLLRKLVAMLKLRQNLQNLQN
uniref:Prepro-polychaete excitatory peptide n=1 Tax=Perinereis vancaurica TaxID=6355 RepID=Q8WST4_PERVA|nr:prepro-polychaete excitatory peptide [Perinereis vancaurica]